MKQCTELSNFIPLMKIGEGAFSSVYKVKRVSDQQIYALKKVKMGILKDKEKTNALNEIRILASIQSPYIITYKEAFFDQKLNLLCIVMEWANQGDLLKKISDHKNKKTPIREEEIWKAAYHILSGLNCLHKNSILHRDLKSANIFIGEGVYKLGDLNVSKVNDAQHRLANTQTGTPFYASPQIWKDLPYGSKSDIWSFGCILYQMCCFRPPFAGDDLNELYRNIQIGYFQSIPSFYSRQLNAFIRNCLRQKAQQRPSAQSLLNPGSQLMIKCDYYDISIGKQENKSQLLSTIKMPQDISQLKNHLPQPKYNVSKTETSQEKTISMGMGSSNIRYQNSSKLTQKIKTQKEEQKIIIPLKDRIPLPQRIKQHLNNINIRNCGKKIISNRRIQSSKHRINSSIIQEQKEIIAKKIEDYFTPTKQEQFKKKRPLSCNHIASQLHSKSPIYLQKLNRPVTAAIRPKFASSDRKLYLLPSHKSNQHYISERMDIIGQIRKKYDRQLISSDKKIRCTSANQRNEASGYNQIRKHFQMRYQNIKPTYPSKSQSKILRNRLPELYISKHKADVSSKQLIERVNRNDSNRYLMQIQTKLMNNSRKDDRALKKSENLLNEVQNNQTNNSRIKRLVKPCYAFAKGRI